MQDKYTFEFAIIRVVPKVEREEFMNVGAILFSKHKKFLSMRYRIDPKRLQAFSCDVELEELNAYLRSWQLICAGGAEAGQIGTMDQPSRFRWLTASRSTIIQSSKTHPGLCTDPQKELDDLFARYVLPD
jgi:hypothetical protein